MKDESPVRVDFRLRRGRIESRVPTPSGDVIATPMLGAIQLRSANGIFVCDRIDRSCH